MSDPLTKRLPKKSTGVEVVQRQSRPGGIRKDPGVRYGVKKAGGGVVSFCIHGPTGNNKASDFGPSKLIEALRVGLPFQELEGLQANLRLPMETLGTLLGISKATLQRRKAGGKLGTAESDRVVRFARLMGKAVEVLESEENARRWLSSIQFGLGGAVPLDYAMTEVGAHEVEDLLGRIEFGVYS